MQGAVARRRPSSPLVREDGRWKIAAIAFGVLDADEMISIPLIRLLAIDIDGRCSTGRGPLPSTFTATRCVDASRAGVDVALVTGRSFHFARPIAELLPVPLTLIVNNGAVVKSKAGATIVRHAAPA